MTEYSEKDLDIALTAIQDPNTRNSEEFKTWISKTENKELFIELMAQNEAIMREKYLEKSSIKLKRKIISLVAAAAAILISAIYLPDFFHHTQPQAVNKDIHFFTANTSMDEVTLEVGKSSPVVIKDSFMVVNASHPQNTAENKIEYQTITTPRGKDFHLTLSDGTKVWINTESCLKYPSMFTGKERRVKLKGEAYFKVAHNNKCPFIVCTEDIETKVLGTKFNVCSYSKEQRNITLVEGKVEVSNNVSKEAKLLLPGQNISYDIEGKPIISNVNTAAYTAWTEGMFYFEDKPLKEIMNTIGRWYNVDIYFENEDLYNITLNFWASRKTSINDAITLLNELGKVNIYIGKDNKIIVNKK